jgi:hypothetical protein
VTDENIVATSDMLILFHQLADGTVAPYVVLNEDVFTLRKDAFTDMPLVVRVAHAFWRLCEEGLFQQALEEAKTTPRGIDTPLTADAICPEVDGLQYLTKH